MKNWNIVAKFKYFAIASAAIILAGLATLLFGGINLGIEFSGGVELTVNFSENITEAQYTAIETSIEETLEDLGLDFNAGQKIQNGDDIEAVRFSYINEVNNTAATDTQMNVILQVIQEGGSVLTDEQVNSIKGLYSTSFDIKAMKSVPAVVSEATSNAITGTTTVDLVGSSVSEKLLRDSMFALLIAVVAILIYIIIRFKSLGEGNFGGFKSASAAIIALLHDVLIMLSFIFIAGILFDLQITSTFVAAVVTIVAYSINNTIVVFDRIRDNNLRFGKAMGKEEIVNLSIKNVFARSLFTSLTTIIAVLVLTILGVSALRVFTIPILIGLLAGTYSSLFIAPSLYYHFSKSKSRQSK